MSLVQRLSEQLQQSLDANFKVTNVEAVLEIIKKLEGIPITKEQLETTRLAKFINGLRRQTADDNLARRSKSLLRQWRALVMPTLAPTQQPQKSQQQQPSASVASNSRSYFLNNISSIQQNGVSALGQPLETRLPPKQQPLPTATLTISSASSSPLMPQQLHQQMGMAPTNRPYNGTDNSTANQPQSQFLNQQPVNLMVGDNSGLLKQRQNQPMNCDNNSTNNSFLLSINTTSDLSDNSQQSMHRNKSIKKEKKPKKSSGKDSSNNNFPSITSFGGVITGDGPKSVQLNHESSLPTTTFFDGSNNSKSKASVKPAAARSLQQPFLFNGDSLSSSQSMSNFPFGSGAGVMNAENLSFSGHFSKVKTNTTPTKYPQGPSFASATQNLTPSASISLIDDDDVVLINSSRSQSPFMPVTSMIPSKTILNAASNDPTPLEILVKESMTPVATVVPVSVTEVKTPKKRGRKKGSKGIDSQLHLQNAINLPSTSAGSGGRDINSYLDMKHKIDSMMPKSKKLKTTQELYAELQNKSKVVSASTSTQVSPSSSSEQSMSTAVDSVASRMATPEPTSQDLSDANASKGVQRNHVATVKQEKDGQVAAVKVEKPATLSESIEDEINRLLGQLPPIDYRAAFEEDEEVLRVVEAEKCMCTMEVIAPDIVPTVEVEAEDAEPTDVAVSITIPRAKSTLEVMRIVKKELPAPIKPQKHVKSIFDLDYDDDNDPIHDFRNSVQSEVVSAVEPRVEVEISVPVLPEAVIRPMTDPVTTTLTEPVIPVPPVFQVEYNIHPECQAMRLFETNPQNITRFHLDALHHQFVPNVNGNWSDLPIYVPSIIKSEPTEETRAETSNQTQRHEDADDKLFDRVVPPYNFLHYEPIPKTHPGLETDNLREIEMKLLLREQMIQRQCKEVNMKTRDRKRKANQIEPDYDLVEQAADSKRIKLTYDDKVGQDSESGGNEHAEAAKKVIEAKEETYAEECKHQKLKGLQESMALSSFLDPNYNFYYSDEANENKSLAENENIEEVAVPFENNNLNMRINADSDVNSERVTEMLRMTIDDDVDIRHKNFFNLKLTSSNNLNDGSCRNELAPIPLSSLVSSSNGIFQNGCTATACADDKQPSSKPDIKLLVASQMSVEIDAMPFVPLSNLQLPDEKPTLTELVQRLNPVMSDVNNGLLSSFNSIQFDLPALTSVSPTMIKLIKQEPSEEGSGSVEASSSERYFREWQDCLNVRSYNDEVITLLPYVVID